MATLPRLKSINDLKKLKYKVLEFDGAWKALIGKPEIAGSWIIWGTGGNGKTSFVLQLTKYLCSFQKVIVLSHEEKEKKTWRDAVLRQNMESVQRNFLYGFDSYEQLIERLSGKRAPRIVIIDSLQHWRINKQKYYRLLDLFPKTLFIFISHAKGNDPKGELADEVRYNSDVKLRVHQFVATPIEATRYGGNVPFVIWEKGMRDAQLKLT